ncbi:MAG: FecR domain-containing protein [Saprospiraceae bacterium]|nr:FecR domain-containing protein [Saprospiraceae bacterium]MBK8852271.1 FecR domain-containing protein [Saprospiraceae bacterium]MBL0083033.1 FecR domain-containing protein [Saprospiraceae bacterium]
MSKEKISIWVHKQLTGQLSAAEQAELEKALAADASHVQLARDVEAVWEKSGSLGDDLSFDGAKAFQRFKSAVAAQSEVNTVAPIVATKTEAKTRNLFIRYASAIAAVLVLGFFAMRWMGNPGQITINSGSTAMVASLPDGSYVKLASNSSLTYNEKTFAASRKVILSGSGIFKVEKTGSGFEVLAGELHVSVLGTTFLVTHDNNVKEVKVMEGRVAVKAADSNKIEITDKEGVSLNNGKLEKIEEVDFSTLSWSDPEMVYNNEPLSKVISDIESKFSVKISIKGNNSIEKCPFTSRSLKNNTLEEILSIIEATFSAKIVKKAVGEYQLSGLSCS